MSTAKQNASAGVHITDDIGVEVTDGTYSRAQLGLLPGGTYGLRVVSSDGTTVIIDGTSSLLAIAATGTLATAICAAGASQQATVTVNTGFTFAPSHLIYALSPVGAILTPYYAWTVATGAIATAWTGWVTVAGSSTVVTVDVTAVAGGAGAGATTFRWYLLQEVAF